MTEKEQRDDKATKFMLALSWLCAAILAVFYNSVPGAILLAAILFSGDKSD